MEKIVKDLLSHDPEEMSEITRLTLAIILKYHEQTRQIVEDVIKDLKEIRNNHENLAVLDTRLHSLEAKLSDFNSHCKDCSLRLQTNLDFNKSKCFDMEKTALTEHNRIITELQNHCDFKIKELTDKYEVFKSDYNKLDKSVALGTAKISIIVVVAFWIIKFLIGLIINHITKGHPGAGGLF